MILVDEYAKLTIKLYQIGSDLILDDAMPVIPLKKRMEPIWAPIFHPKQWVQDHPNQT